MPGQGWRRALSREQAMAVVAAELAVMFIGATLPTPLYPLYRHAFGFGGVTLTLIYAVYVLGNLVALLAFGRLSDQIGRRLATLTAIGIGIGSTLVFALATGTPWLFAARVLSGLATGLAAGAATAWIAELQPHGDKATAAMVASSANLVGLAIGPLLAGALAQLAPRPLRISYIAYLAMLFVTGAVVFAVPETVKDRTRRLSDLSLRPRLGVPREIRLPFISPAVTAFATFALIGFYAALIPSLLAESLHRPAPIVAGSVVFELFLIAAVTAILTRKLRSPAAMLSGLALLPPGIGLLVAAELLKSLSLLLIAAVLGGITAALGYRGSLEVVNGIAPSGRRAEVTSTYLVACYVGNSLPVIGIGLLSALSGSVPAHIAFAVLVTILAAAALVASLAYAPRR